MGLLILFMLTVILIGIAVMVARFLSNLDLAYDRRRQRPVVLDQASTSSSLPVIPVRQFVGQFVLTLVGIAAAIVAAKVLTPALQSREDVIRYFFFLPLISLVMGRWMQRIGLLSEEVFGYLAAVLTGYLMIGAFHVIMKPLG